MLICSGYKFRIELNPMPRGLYPVGEGAGVRVVFFRLVCGVQEPIFGKSNSWSGSVIVS